VKSNGRNGRSHATDHLGFFFVIFTLFAILAGFFVGLPGFLPTGLSPLDILDLELLGLFFEAVGL
jgi:hypothetical protein